MDTLIDQPSLHFNLHLISQFLLFIVSFLAIRYVLPLQALMAERR